MIIFNHVITLLAMYWLRCPVCGFLSACFNKNTDLSAQLGMMMPLAGVEALLCRRPDCNLGLDWTGLVPPWSSQCHSRTPDEAAGNFSRVPDYPVGSLMNEQCRLELQGLLQLQTPQLDEKHLCRRLALQDGRFQVCWKQRRCELQLDDEQRKEERISVCPISPYYTCSSYFHWLSLRYLIRKVVMWCCYAVLRDDVLATVLLYRFCSSSR